MRGFPPHQPTIRELRADLVDDSISRSRTLDRLIKLVREDERGKTLEDLRIARDRADQATA